jgi:hypothetical protein
VSRSRLQGSTPHTSRLLTLNVFLNFYSDYQDGLNVFNEWLKLV